ncbi:MAG: hypothetical protein ACD_29C00266G0004 [uncultured bacterium]|nr:MAG: hypothetical protein ACD_29C00266G0004 [uncultured bacterium]
MFRKILCGDHSMKILILHRIPYQKIDYHRGIDHQKHDVTYIGIAESMCSIPNTLRCEMMTRPGIEKTEIEVQRFLQQTKKQFDRIISLSEYELLAAAQLREWFNVEGSRPQQVEKVRDKLIMKKAMENYGIKTPLFMSLVEFMRTNPSFMHTNKLVIKPIDGASSENIITVDNAAEAHTKILGKKTGIDELDQSHNLWNHYEIEEFIDGNIMHMDGLVQDGKIMLCIASKYINNCLDYARGKPLGSVQIETTSVLQQYAQKCVTAAEIVNGSFHLECIDRNGELFFLEIANRVGGADVVKTMELATGVHLPSAELQLLINESFHPNVPKFSRKKYGWFVFPGHHFESEFVSISNSDAFRMHPYVFEWFQLSPYQACKKNITYQSNESPVAGVVAGYSSENLMNWMQTMFSEIHITNHFFKVAI